MVVFVVFFMKANDGLEVCENQTIKSGVSTVQVPLHANTVQRYIVGSPFKTVTKADHSSASDSGNVQDKGPATEYSH